MLTIYVADPEAIIKLYSNAIGLACDKCALEYSLDDYKILKDNHKLIYFWGDMKQMPNEEQTFSHASTLLCHDCFFKELKNVCGDNEITLRVVGVEEETTIQFTPSEIVDDFNLDDGDDSNLGLF